MWNQWRTDVYEGMSAELIQMKGHNGNNVHAYFAKPSGRGPYPGIVLVHHLPGWDELYREIARRFTEHGYVVICPDLYEDFGHDTPENVAANVRGRGGVPDASVVGDCEAALNYLKGLPYCNGKVGIIGTCSGGRHAFLTACRVKGFSAIVDCWGGNVVMPKERLTPQQPVAPIDYTKDLSCPILGLFGNDDQSPPPDQVNQHEAELKRHNKMYEFHRYDGAGHAFWYYDRAAYRPQQAMDAWGKTFAFFEKHLS
ncbi:MAG: dienelactone hydrolase family protein [Chloroflexi bacterium]|nr:dienelactone hydrolase family protein [Chloroflexota bacterium]